MEPKITFESVNEFLPIEGHDALLTDSKMAEFIFDRCEIEFLPENRFFCLTELIESNYIAHLVIGDRFDWEFAPYREEVMEQAIEAGAFGMKPDFGHTAPNWIDVLELGFAGLKRRAERFAAGENQDPQCARFYSAVLREYEAAERFICRVIQKAMEEGRNEIADSLKNLLVAPPDTLFEAIQMLLLFYTMQHTVEGTWIRTFGRVDQLLYPFYCKMNREEADGLIRDFIIELNCHQESANLPFSIGGSDKDGNDLVNELTYSFLENYKELNLPWVKIHILCSDHMPEPFMKSALDGVRKGANSLLFLGDTMVKKALRRLGIEEEDIVDYHVDGCYECGGFGEVVAPAMAKISIPKAVELALNNGQDMMTGYAIGLQATKRAETFEEFYEEFLRQLNHICDCTRKYVIKMERLFHRLHAGALFSSTYRRCMENGTDIFADCGAKYNNTSITACGLGTAVDALMGIKKIVFDDRMMSLDELNTLMRNNWEGQEVLRLRAKNKFPKFGMADAAVDVYAANIVDVLGEQINKKQNGRNGVFRLGMYSITARWEFGRRMAATPDGRLAGETISQNSSASFGADREGATAHILSVTAVDATNAPTSVVLDLDMHSSAVKGENGLQVLYATLKTYLKNGGFAIHYNVLNTDVLRAVQKNPDDYPNLQVRYCGWNCLFTQLSKESQDEFIARAGGE